LEAQHRATEARVHAATLRLKDLEAAEAEVMARIAKAKGSEANIIAAIDHIEGEVVRALDRLLKHVEAK
jgi:hypothetical protein